MERSVPVLLFVVPCGGDGMLVGHDAVPIGAGNSVYATNIRERELLKEQLATPSLRSKRKHIKSCIAETLMCASFALRLGR